MSYEFYYYGPDESSALSVGALLNKGIYRIVRLISNWPWGYVYEAQHTVFNEKVVIKELFVDNCYRSNMQVQYDSHIKPFMQEFKEVFIHEAQFLRQYDHRGIPHVLDMFECNSTIYYVTEYIDSTSLQELMDQRTTPLPEPEAKRIISRLADIVAYIHSTGHGHYGLNLRHIFIDSQSEISLTGCEKIFEDEYWNISFKMDSDLVEIPSIYRHNPFLWPTSQSDKDKDLRPFPDIYSLGAIFYYLLSGILPPDHMMKIYGAVTPQLPNYVSKSSREAVNAAMKCKTLKSVAEFIDMLDMEEVMPASKDMTQMPKPQIEMVRVEGGAFLMGSDDPEAHSDEKPVHTVAVSDFLMSKYEVTHGLWKSVMGYSFKRDGETDDSPVCVDWYYAQDFIRQLNRITGLNYRMPTEAEWEFAARGGKLTRGYKYAGSNDINEVARYHSNIDYSARQVGTKKPNELGLYDMSGCALEWCSDFYSRDYYARSPIDDPTGPASGSKRVVRGGTDVDAASDCRTTSRGCSAPDVCPVLPGFRLVLPNPPAVFDTTDDTTQDTTTSIDCNSELHKALSDIEMVRVEGGPFRMIVNDSHNYRSKRYIRSVTLPSFSIAKYPVTVGLWCLVLGRYKCKPEIFNIPMVRVTWQSINDFIDKLNEITGKCYRLPTEAEWEYAARGGIYSHGYKFAGSNDLASVAWYAGNSDNTTHPVGMKAPNELGLYDMSGNVWEWCQDRYSQPEATSPVNVVTDFDHVLRGGSWYVREESCRVDARTNLSPAIRHNTVGFRLAL